jgi:membrane-associated phospholipid phosphatase
MRSRPCSPALITLAGLTLAGCGDLPARATGEADDTIPSGNLAIEWNRRLLEVAEAEDHFLTLKGVRTASMMHLAMHDALNAIDARYASYRFQGAVADADPVAAATQAAWEVAVEQYPDRKAVFDSLRTRWLAQAPDGDARAKGEALGKAAAEAVVGSRDGDGWDAEAEYTFHPMGPGVYAEFHEHSNTPQGFVFGAGWAGARPFFLERADHFRAPPPPEIGSDAYARAFDEVKEVGRDASTTRTADQTHLALWWKEFIDKSMNRLARQVVAAEEIDLWDAVRLFALVDANIFDGYVSVFENKFHYNHWRPYTAIRWAEHDGNPSTVADPDWDNTHHHTYAFPSYPSAHGTVAASALTILAKTFGDDYAFTLSTPEVNEAGPMSPMIPMDPPERSFSSFSEAAMEAAMSRVYLGIHFRYDSEEGYALGRRIGEYAWDHHLTPR